MEDDDNPQSQQQGPDKRPEWLTAKIVNSLKIKEEQATAILTNESTKDTVSKFLNEPDCSHLLIYFDGKDYIAALSPPQKFSKNKKSCFFVKSRPESLTNENISKLVLFGDFGESPLEYLAAMSEEVLMPILSNPHNQQGWPDVITKEVVDNLHKFCASVYVTLGQMKGKTLLPLPPMDLSSDVDREIKDKDRIHVLEGAVVTWTRQIKNVLKADPETALKEVSAYPGPLNEMDFWISRAGNLNSIYEQLTGERVRKVVRVLELTKSTYHPAFVRLAREVELARLESNSNVKYLKPLRRYFEKLSMSDDFLELTAVFKPMMHLIMLIWKHSKYYNTPSRLVILMREVCNDLIAQACKFVSGEEILKDEPQAAVDKLKSILKVCGTFKSCYFDYKNRSSTETPENPWRFQNSALFGRLDAFLERCHDILDLMQIMLQFQKLEKVEIGNTQGKNLTTTARQIFSEFQSAVEKFQAVQYDIMDVEIKQFDDDFYEFRVIIKELERRLGGVVTQAFDDCSTVVSTFKLLDAFEGLLDREIIASDMEKKTADLVKNAMEDLKNVFFLFRACKDAPPIAKNAAPHSGAVAWVRSLRQRIDEPMARITSYQGAEQVPEVKELQTLYDSLLQQMDDYEKKRVLEWCAEIESTSDDKLKLPLLLRDEKSKDLPLLKVNFDPALVRLLREVKYFMLLGVEVPESASKIFEKNETFRRQVGNLDLIVGIYNSIQRSLLEIERPLVIEQLNAADEALKKALTTLNWNSHKIDAYISDVMTQVKEISKVLSTLKGNVESTRQILTKWSANIMFERKEGKVYSVTDMRENFNHVLSMRHQAITDGAKEIHALLSKSNRALRISKGSTAWKNYVEYVGDIVVDGMSAAILSSMRYLHGQVDPKNIATQEIPPLIEIALELVAPEIVWVPEIREGGSGNGIRVLFVSFLKGFMNVAPLVKRLDTGEGDYAQELEEDFYIRDAMSESLGLVLANEAELDKFHASFQRFEYLWKNDLQTTLHEFLEKNAVVMEDGSKDDPELAKFDAEIARYKKIQEEIQALPVSATIGWLKVDAKPIKQALGTWVTKWIFLYTHYLQNKVTKSLEELYEFVTASDSVLDIRLGDERSAAPAEDEPPAEAPAEGAEGEGEAAAPAAAKPSKEDSTKLLYEVMACIRDIRKRADRTDNMFDPLKATVALLRSHGIQMSDQIVKRLDEAPMSWRNIKKKMASKREGLALMQQLESAEVRRRSDAFGKKVEDFREFFLHRAPFTVSGELSAEHITESYATLDAFHHGRVEEWESVQAIIAESERLRESQDLFELFVSDYVSLTRCNEELESLKALWDMASVVLFTFHDWTRTLWDKIDVDQLMEECKKLSKEVKMGVPKSARAFEVYRMLEEKLKAMMTSLPLVQDLHHPAMRERHWKALMKATNKFFTMDENFSLGNLLELELHKFVDVVSEIVDRAQKELIIEKALKKIEETWSALQITYTAYPEMPDVFQFTVDDAIIESLEADNMALQNMGNSKYVQGNPKFQELVNAWQKKLGAVDSVLSSWNDVQRKWQALESIFVGSADIRIQLPEDAKRFDGINQEFKDLMRSAPDTTNVVEACNLDGRQEKLDDLLSRLEMCEKALQDYLETKRIAFPRFYFVAPADLLDILSKGSNPQAIIRHLPKNFDNVHNLDFKKNESGHPTKAAIGMYSGEKEYVPFASDCMCDGPVEVWLQTVVDSMKAALSFEFKGSMHGYEEKHRREWLFDQSAQMTIVVSRVYFTQQINDAFTELEEGNEEALKNEYGRQVSQLSDLIEVINGELTGNDRKKLITICTIDVHARDVTQRLIDERVENGQCFQWQSQLRYFQNEKTMDVQVNILDAEIIYNYEYIGNVGCLCITPLTDRCYITLTQAQRLVLGGAPAGPAGTGKTETTKDLARALGVQCYVFNCSDQMDYKAMGQIYKGLAQTGAWGCFDEFNRIPVAVLSVCSTQYKTVLDALRAKRPRFIFEDVEIALRSTVMAFITMNPGYPGRAELPESLKALFRPVSMVVPDLALICEIMLMAEGFQMSKILSKKFVILYQLCQDLLSKSAHYDWKLRAIKTTLYVAGGMKRAAPNLSEDKVLLRALRDFNLGKLTDDDTSIFMGLLNDLFPKTLELVPRAIDEAFEKETLKAAHELGYHHEGTDFCLKISQLREIFVVRWSVFLLGPAGCGKTALWRTLMRAQNNFGEKTVFKPINPKAVTRNELYGYLHPQTREWKEGLISVTFRDMALNQTNRHQWIVLDGDIDAEWIESMNTVMDDNKMLTLASNERIPLTPTMRLLLEINHMNHCSPATVSRGGVIFVNESDVGWSPVVYSWIENLEIAEIKPLLMTFFSRYVDKTLEHCRRNFKTVTPIPAVSQVQTVCKILEGILPKEVHPGHNQPIDKKLLEFQFVFACIWAFGGSMLVDKVYDYRTEFSKWWTSEFKTVTFPENGLVFDYFVDEKQIMFVPWSEKVQSFGYANDGNFANLFVPTVETTRLTYFLDSLIANKHYVMFIGTSGTGKTAIMRDKLKNMDPEAMGFYTINMNSFSDAPSLQLIMEQPLEKKSGVRFGPPGSKRMVYFFDDFNMPYLDRYDTQSAIELARQFIDYHGWFDKVKIVLKEILNCQYAASMNPTAGSFFITPRMQRHFATFAVHMPAADIVKSIYLALIGGHMANFDTEISAMAPRIVDATIELHKHVMNNFLPSAVKFHYQFNLRDLSNIAQGICRMVKEYYGNPATVVRLWIHECERVFSDRMVTDADMTKFAQMRETVTKKYFSDMDQATVEDRPILFTSFMTMTGDETPVYTSVPTFDKLKKVLEEQLVSYNESNAVMELVLFQQAMEHVVRVARILSLPRGNAMLVGVGGSGKQSLARLSSFICGYEVFQISVTSTYNVNDLKADLLNLYTKAGMKSIQVSWIFTDNQIINERFLVYINDLLSSGFIADLCLPEDKENFCNSVRNEAKQAGIIDSTENLWDFFIEKVRRLLHVVLCFSPVGDKFRIRARQFPALVNCTAWDWFHSWPHEALVSVASRFLADVPDLTDTVRENIAFHMAFAHSAVTDASRRYYETVRRYNYTTPKSYLELISLYKQLLTRKREEVRLARERLESGLDKIANASAQVADLQINLKQEQIIVEEKKAKTDTLIVSIGQEKAIVDEAVESSRDDEDKCAKLAEEVMAFQAECSKDLEAAEPVIQEAEKALNSLEKSALNEMKSFSNPAAEIVSVAAACMVLTAPKGKIPKDLSWQAAKKMMGNIDQFIRSLQSFDKDNVPENCVDRCEADFISQPGFNADNIQTKSFAAAGLCSWIVNICKYFRIYQVVQPKREKLAEANLKLEGANKKLTGIRAKVKELQDKVANLEEALMRATEDKNAAVAQADKTARKAALAERLIQGLAGERQRWGETVERLKIAENKTPGDVLLAAAFVSYAGPFNLQFRTDLVQTKWIPDLKERSLPMTDDVQPLDVLMNESIKAKWNNEGLPTDPLSVQNGAIMTNASRWPLFIDPQLQGIKWIINKEKDHNMKIIQLSQNKYLDIVANCIENGVPLMIENIREDIDAVLDPLIARQTIRRGRNVMMKLGDKEVEYDPRFRLYLQTKLANPHYKPEIAAQTTLLNFCVTEKGLEDQLLALVVEKERPDLQQQAQDLVRALGDYTIQLSDLEDNLLFRLANAQGDILEDIELIENLEETKRTAVEIEENVKLARVTALNITTAREVYRPVAARGSLVYFLVDSLNALDRVYHYSMENFIYILKKAIDVTPGGASEDLVPPAKRTGEKLAVEQRVPVLIDNCTYVIFQYIAQGLFERHKLIMAGQLALAILKQKGELDFVKLDFLLRGPKATSVENPLSEWISNSCWQTVQALKELEGYQALPDDLVGSAKRWREWLEIERPEDEPPPGDWKRMPEFDQLLLYRALRPDRVTAAMSKFVRTQIGAKYTESQAFDLERSFQDSNPGTPIFVFLSPGVDVAGAVEAYGRKLGFTSDTGKYAAVSLGQGQENIAMTSLKNAHKNGGWVLLQNIHLTIDWTAGPLEKTVDKLAEGAHPDFRLFLSAEPPPSLERALPISILQASIKLTNEPPEGVKANLLRAYNQFSEEMLEGCSKNTEFRCIIFALCYFHAVLIERKKFGVGNLPNSTSGLGWNMNYPFNTGDLLCCGQVAANYLELNSKVPWEDLRYVFGEIMYGGHIVEDWDRRLANAYLLRYLNEELLEGINLFPEFNTVAGNLSHKQVVEVVENMPVETPMAFGLHPNAQIGFKLREAETFCSSVLNLQPREASGESGQSVEERAKMTLDEIMEKLPDYYDMEDIRGRIDEFTPYIMVAIQESERMNILLAEIKRSLIELDLGLKGDLTMSESMERLMFALANNAVPGSWTKLAYPSLRPLMSWIQNLLLRCTQLTEWTGSLAIPNSVWLSGLFNPQSFLTAVMQTTARRNDWPLDKTVVLTEVTRKQVEQIDAPSRDGAYIHGLTLEGARWDDKAGTLDESKPKELFCPMPVILIRAVTQDKAEIKDAYQCPVYTTEARFRQEVFTAQLKSKHSWIKWTLSGVAAFLDIAG